MTNEIKEEIIDSILKFYPQNKDEITRDVLMQFDEKQIGETLAAVASEKFRSKFISPTIFEKDKLEIFKICYMQFAKNFAVALNNFEEPKLLQYRFQFEEIIMLMENGCSVDAENTSEASMYDNAYFIVK